MPVKTRIPYDFGVFFITFTCFKWLNLIDIADAYGSVYGWFNTLKENLHYILGYVIMPNHVHSLIGFRNCGRSINSIVGRGKRFSAYDIIDGLKAKKQEDILELLYDSVNHSDRARNKIHEPWKDSFDWKLCDSWELMEQKLDYMHENPCTGKWQLVENPVDYVHSSAKFYYTGEQGIYPVTNYMEMDEIDLSI
jgi:REP element-mobilizing transposase RayT